MMSQADKIRFVNTYLAQIAEVLEMKAAVLVLSSEAVGGVYRWPACTSDCEDPALCSRIYLSAASDYLAAQADDLSEAALRAMGTVPTEVSRD